MISIHGGGVLSDSYRKVLLFAFPVALSNITAPLLGAVDTGVLGHLSSSVYISGVGIGAELFTFITWIFGFLRMGTTAMTAPLCGKGADQHSRDILVQGLSLSLLIGCVMILLAWPISLIASLFYGASQAVTAEMKHFFFIRIFSAPASLANLAITGWLLGMQKARAPLVVVLVSNFVNIVLDLWFVLGLGWASKGVATGSLIASWCALAMNLWMVYETRKKLKGHFRFSHAITWSAIKPILLINRQLFVRTLCLLLVFAIITAWGAREGTNVLAANTILLNLVMIAACFLDGIANAAEAKIGLVTGCSDRSGFTALLKTTGVCSAVLVVCCSAVFAFFGSNIISLFTNIGAVRQIAEEYLVWLVFFPLAAGGSYWLDGVFIGMGRTDMMQRTMMFAAVVFFLPMCWIFHDYGNTGLWISLTVFMVARSFSMLWALCFRCLPAVYRKMLP